MKLVSTTLVAPGSEPLIGDALRSVAGIVDAAIVIWTGAFAADADLRGFTASGVDAIMTHWPWRDDFAAARNAALDFAAEAGATHALTLDADERILLNGEDLRAVLAEPFGAWMALAEDETYQKERVFRVPSGARWEGRTHEAYPGHMDPRGRRTLERLRFAELLKSSDQMITKCVRDERILREEIVRDPACTRWHFYLGVALRGQGKREEAIESFRACAQLRGWPEESACACYEAADLLVQLGRYEEAIEACAAGLVRHPGIAELCWLAGVACWALARADDAIAWAKLARVHGAHGDRVALDRRISFRHHRGIGPGPCEILRAAGIQEAA